MKRFEKNKNTLLFSGEASGLGLYFSTFKTSNLYKHLLIKFLLNTENFIQKFTVIILLFTLTNTYGYSDNNTKEPNKSLTYNIIRKDEVIGKIEINQTTSGDSIIYNIESDVKGRFILNFKVVGKEKYIYKNGTLVYSSLFRTLNNKVKTNHSILYNQGEYTLQTPEKISPLNIENIKCNLMILYVNEPIGVKSVFCDNQQQMVKVELIGKGIYKVELSRNKYNIFHYENGRCVKINAVSPLFDVTLIPVQS